MTTAIYARYSSDLQSERSIDDQIAVCREFAQRRGLSGPFVIYSDAALSGASMATRPGILSLVADLRSKKIHAVIAEAIDRLSRDQMDVHAIRRAAAAGGAILYTLADGEVNGMNAGLQGIMAEAFLVNLAQKTRRGLKGVARSGRIAGGLCYGYRPVPDKRGERSIDEAEAAIVRRIFTQYVNGASPHAIARALNAEGVAAPRGKLWKVTTLLGDPRIGDGVLCNELYRGRIVFNRRRFTKNPETGKRSSTINPESEWITVEAPQLRIVDDELFAAAQRLRRRLRRELQNDTRRPKRVFSGLLTCGQCGGLFTVRNRGRIACSNVINGTGLCEQNVSVSAELVERRVIEGLKRTLLTPDVIEKVVKTFHEERRLMAVEESRQRITAQRTLEEARRRGDRIAEQLIESPSALLRAKLAEAETKIAVAETELAQIPDASVIAMHPNAAGAYAAQVAMLDAALTDGGPEIRNAARGLVERIALAPAADAPDGWTITVYGQLAAFLALANEKGPAVSGRAPSGMICEPSMPRVTGLPDGLGRPALGAGARTGCSPTAWPIAA